MGEWKGDLDRMDRTLHPNISMAVVRYGKEYLAQVRAGERCVCLANKMQPTLESAKLAAEQAARAMLTEALAALGEETDD